ncbi:MAG: hypothetical protein ACKOEM_04010 [Planctomycetia bacterium]
MASGELGHDNLQRALAGLTQALALDCSLYPDFVRDVLENGRIQKFEYCADLFWRRRTGFSLSPLPAHAATGLRTNRPGMLVT